MVAPKTGKRVLIVEGGGDHNQALQTECRKAFKALQESAGIPRKARVCVAGGRTKAYDRFKSELKTAQEGDRIVLLVDAEEVVAQGQTRWGHVKQRGGDGWEMPSGATEDNLQFMAVVMETWLLAEPTGLETALQGVFDAALVPKWPDHEAIPKQKIYDTLKRATTGQARDGYDKGQHSFKALMAVQATVLAARCPSAKSLFDVLKG
jgi:hypothetical protein